MSSQNIKQFTVSLSTKVIQQSLKTNSEYTEAIHTISKIKNYIQPSVTDLWRSDKSDTPEPTQQNGSSSPLSNTCMMGNGKGGRGRGGGKGKSTLDARTPTYTREKGGAPPNSIPDLHDTVITDSPLTQPLSPLHQHELPSSPPSACLSPAETDDAPNPVLNQPPTNNTPHCTDTTPPSEAASDKITPSETTTAEHHSPTNPLDSTAILPTTPTRPTPTLMEPMDSSTPSNKRTRGRDSPDTEQKPAKIQQLPKNDSPTLTSIDTVLPATSLPSSTTALQPQQQDSIDHHLQQQVATLLQLQAPAQLQQTIERIQSAIMPEVMQAILNHATQNNNLHSTATKEITQTFSTLTAKIDSLAAKLQTIITDRDMDNLRVQEDTMAIKEDVDLTTQQLSVLEVKIEKLTQSTDSLQRTADTQAARYTMLLKEIEERFTRLRTEMTPAQSTMEVDGVGAVNGAENAGRSATGADHSVDASIKSFLLKGIHKLREFIANGNSLLLKADPAAIVEKLLQHQSINYFGAVCRVSAVDIKNKESRMDSDIMIIEMSSLFQKRGATIRIREYLRRNGLLPGVQISDCYQQTEQLRARALTRYAGSLKEQTEIDGYRVNNRAGIAVLQTFKGVRPWYTHNNITEEQLLPYYTIRAEREKTTFSASQHKQSSPSHPLHQESVPLQQQLPSQQQQLHQQQQQQPPPRPHGGGGVGGRGNPLKGGGAIPKSFNNTSSHNKVIIRSNSSTTTTPQELTRKESSELIKNALLRKELIHKMTELDARDKALGLQPNNAGAAVRDANLRNGILNLIDSDHSDNNL